jgi:hypothetical protein
MRILVGTFVTALERCTFVTTAQYSAFTQQLRSQQADAAVHAAISGATAASLTGASSNNDHSSSSDSSSTNSSSSSSDASEDNITNSSSSDSSSSGGDVEQDFTQPFVLQWHQDAFGLEDPLGAVLNKLALINRTPTDNFVQREHSLTTLAIAGDVPLWRVTLFHFQLEGYHTVLVTISYRVTLSTAIGLQVQCSSVARVRTLLIAA